jgi:arylsulfatase A-like enzyme
VHPTFSGWGVRQDWLEARGRYRDTLVVFVSDHGEGFWEHGVNGHGWDLFEEAIRVPLVIKPAGLKRAGERRRDIVQHVDLVPTLLEATGLEVPDGLAGRSLLGAETGDDLERVAFSEMTYEGREGIAVRWRQYKLIEPLSSDFLPRRSLFDLDRDPGESNPVMDRPVISAWLALEGRRYLARLGSAPEAGADVELDAVARKGLEALGYLEPAGR